MYNLTKILISTALLLHSTLGFSSPIEGKQYSKLSEPYETSHPHEKFFSLTCGPCWKMTSILHPSEQSGELELNRVHVVFNDSTRASANLYYAFLVQKKSISSEMLNDLFHFQQKYSSNNQNKRRELFEKYDLLVPEKMSINQKQQVDFLMKNAESKTKQAQITRIPSFVVNGQYLVRIKGHSSVQDLLNTLQYLETQTTK